MLRNVKRECGACFACCIAFDIDAPTLSKPSGVECPWVREFPVSNQAGQGSCGCYQTRPKVCADYTCSWLKGEFRADERPDRLGAVFDYRPAPIPGWYVREVSDVLSNPTSRASRRLLQCKKEMYTTYGKVEVVGVTRYDGTQYAYLPNGAIEKNSEKLQPIKVAPPESFIQLRKKEK